MIFVRVMQGAYCLMQFSGANVRIHNIGEHIEVSGRRYVVLDVTHEGSQGQSQEMRFRVDIEEVTDLTPL